MSHEFIPLKYDSCLWFIMSFTLFLRKKEKKNSWMLVNFNKKKFWKLFYSESIFGNLLTSDSSMIFLRHIYLCVIHDITGFWDNNEKKLSEYSWCEMIWTKFFFVSQKIHLFRIVFAHQKTNNLKKMLTFEFGKKQNFKIFLKIKILKFELETWK